MKKHRTIQRAGMLLALGAVLAAGGVLAAWLVAEPDGWTGRTCYALLCPLGVDSWFPAEMAVELSEDAREADLARLEEVCGRLVDIDWRWRVEKAPDGRTARVKVRTWHPARSRALAAAIRREFHGGLWEMPLPEGWSAEGTLGEACRALEAASKDLDPAGRGLRFEVPEELAGRAVKMGKMENWATFRDAAFVLTEIAPASLQAVFFGDTAILAEKGCFAKPVVFALEARDAETGAPIPGARVANQWGLGAWTGGTEDGGGEKMCLLYVPAWQASIGDRWLGAAPEELEAEIAAEGFEPAKVRLSTALHPVAYIPVLRVEMRRTAGKEGKNAPR